jgi:hypothetical protein
MLPERWRQLWRLSCLQGRPGLQGAHGGQQRPAWLALHCKRMQLAFWIPLVSVRLSGVTIIIIIMQLAYG